VEKKKAIRSVFFLQEYNSTVQVRVRVSSGGKKGGSFIREIWLGLGVPDADVPQQPQGSL